MQKSGHSRFKTAILRGLLTQWAVGWLQGNRFLEGASWFLISYSLIRMTHCANCLCKTIWFILTRVFRESEFGTHQADSAYMARPQ